MPNKKSDLERIYIGAGSSLGVVAGAMWAAGLHGEGLVIAGLAGLTGTGIWQVARAARRNRRMAMALRAAIQTGVIGGELPAAGPALSGRA